MRTLIAAATTAVLATVFAVAAQAGQTPASPATASPSASSPDAAVRATIQQINPNAKITSIKPLQMSGMSQVVADGSVVYISNDGRYLFHGTLLDVKARQNLTEIAGADARASLLQTIPASDKIVFKPKGTPKYKVTVFTDLSCHYCQELHKHLDEYLAKGIELDYVPFPRAGTESPVYGQMIAVWCSKDRLAAYNSAIAGRAVPALACANPVAKTYALGERLNIEGTPAIFTPSGMQLGGFLPPDQMLTALQAEDARVQAALAPATPAVVER